MVVYAEAAAWYVCISYCATRVETCNHCGASLVCSRSATKEECEVEGSKERGSIHPGFHSTGLGQYVFTPTLTSFVGFGSKPIGLLISLFLKRVLLKGLACYHFCVSTQDGSEDSETTHLCTRSVMSSLIPRLHVVAGE